jgi:putative lumazine-binding protein
MKKLHTMKKLILIILLFSTLLLAAQNTDQEKDGVKKTAQTTIVEEIQNEEDLIKEVIVQYYFKGLKERNFSLIRAICISETKLYGVRKDRSLNVTSLDQWSKNFNPDIPPFKTLDYKIKKIDIEGTAAQVKILFIIDNSEKIHDFLNLLKIENHWRIVNIIDY